MFDYKKIAYRDSRIENLNKSEKIEYVKTVLKHAKMLNRAAILDRDKEKVLYAVMDDYFDNIKKAPITGLRNSHQ